MIQQIRNMIKMLIEAWNTLSTKEKKDIIYNISVMMYEFAQKMYRYYRGQQEQGAT